MALPFLQAKKTAGRTLYLPRRSFRGDGRNAQGGGNPDWEYWKYYEYKEGNMAAREPWAVEVPENMALEPAALKQRGSAVTCPRACHGVA